MSLSNYTFPSYQSISPWKCLRTFRRECYKISKIFDTEYLSISNVRQIDSQIFHINLIHLLTSNVSGHESKFNNRSLWPSSWIILIVVISKILISYRLSCFVSWTRKNIKHKKITGSKTLLYSPLNNCNVVGTGYSLSLNRKFLN